MQRSVRRAADFAGGLIAGAVFIALAWNAFPLQESARMEADMDAALQRREALRTAAEQASPTPAPLATADVRRAAATGCAFEPLLAQSSAADGRFAVASALALDAQGNPAAYVDVARQAAREHRMRDAEVAFIVACRLGAAQPGGAGAQLAQVQEDLATHYAAAAEAAPAAERHPLIWARVRMLFEASLRTYMDLLGRNSPKAQAARARLDALAGPARQRGQQRAVAPHPATAQPALQLANTRRSDFGAPPHASRKLDLPSRTASHDPDLAQLESDLRRLQAQAEAVSSEPAALRRRSEQARAQRDARCAAA